MAEMKKGRIDWDKIKERLRKADEALASAAAEGARGILKKRAAAFAAPPGEDEEHECMQAVVFTLGGERFAFETAYLNAVCPASEIVPVPCTPSFVLGIVSLRGQMFSIIDLRKFFELPDRGISDMNRLLVLSSETMRFGVLADTVEGVRALRSDELKKLPTLSGVREEYLVGVSPHGITVLDAGKLLADKSIIVYETADQA
ncbi:MAG: purine-binding chemotaxis protein CheW [Deltaproteobacteria bacterium]|nr:purine-binding chemotaxis protein CheW [Deltaproteobacteria bacterium]